MLLLSQLIHSLRKSKQKHILNLEHIEKELQEARFHGEYQATFSPNNKTKVYIHQTGFKFPFTRFYQSSINKEFNFFLVDEARDAEVVVFINATESGIARPEQKIILFYHEPEAYKHLYQSTIADELLSLHKMVIISQIDDIKKLIKSESGADISDRITHIRTIPHVHFHHMAEAAELDTIKPSRKKLICSVVSGFNGVPGYEDRRQFLEEFSRSTPHFDIYGRYSKSIQSLPAYRGYAASKYKTISQYRYNLAIENSVEDWYISEKIFDALLCGCMPIYYGSEKIFDLLPNEWFHFLPDLSPRSVRLATNLAKTDSYLSVVENRAEIAREIDEKFSFYRKLEGVVRNSANFRISES
jgi:Glycosyltransferase family 10 (fucosyltransferase) C-term